mmetsp:Transcript_51794/g.110671  ORF Transcript_51794/g.110671 Transcript_51794/m.110671 type:complete len:133 (+) Transcript_51794:535-933(+)
MPRAPSLPATPPCRWPPCSTRLCCSSARAGSAAPTRRYGYSAISRSITASSCNVMLVVCLLPVFLGLWIGASRVRENDHHPADVVGGALIGGSFAVMVHSRYFHAPFSQVAHMPRRPAQSASAKSECVGLLG